MKRALLGLFAATVVGTAALAQNQIAATPALGQQVPKMPDTTLVGCVIQGSGPTVFLLDNARPDTDDRPAVLKTYVLASATEDLDFAHQLNHEVRITGSADAKVAPVPPPGQRVPEKDLPTFSAMSINSIADTCTTAHR